MYVRATLLLLALSSTSEAAPFDNLKADLASCLRFEMEGSRGRGQARGGAEYALQRCAYEVERLDRADGRRLRGDQGLSPSTWSVLRSVFGAGNRGGTSRRDRVRNRI
ncbi:hypothetical protein MPPM_3870 [Methylorubrum populi]|uniref:Uncharacterized protein n=1 Tax=Methylorubrum populi TaxID=223967 RepID=A0A160PI33_9HYPH|nr:hypothetical protein MPPM_3870 [Methylorubrum populi]